MSLYFIRHGESRSNEQNLFAGRIDTPLTELGRCQAIQAKQIIKQRALVFDEIHASPLSRAFDTATLIAEGTGLELQIAPNLVERDFGLLSEQNKSLIKKYYGAGEFEAMFHSAESAPPQGESFVAMYERVKKYYDEVLEPKSQAGLCVLVVAHKYIVEMFALIAAGLAPEQYHDFKIPNSKPCSWDDLKSRALGASPSLNTVAEEVEARLPSLILLGVAVGVLLKLALNVSLPQSVFTALTIAILAFNSWISLLRLETRTFLRSPLSVRKIWKGAVLRSGIGVIFLLFFHSPWLHAAGTFLLLPPAMTAPTLSLMWGGNYFLSMQSTLLMSLVSPLMLGLVVWFAGPQHLADLANLKLFFLILTLSVLVPGILAQIYRVKKPIDSGAITTNWGWLGGASMIPLAMLAAFQFSYRPAVNVLTLGNHGTDAINLLCALALFAGIRLIGMAASRLTRGDQGLKLDVYISHIAPNIFFWFSLLPQSPDFASVRWIATVLFFVSIYFEEQRFVRAFPRLAGLLPLKKDRKGLYALRTRS